MSADPGYEAWKQAREKRLKKNGTPPVVRRLECGTTPGYAAHIRNGETPCDDCQQRWDANASRRTAECGTLAGWRAHDRLGEPKCDRCIDAVNKDRRERWHNWKTVPPKKRGKPVCGTVNGAYKHYRDGTPVCDRCKAALNADRAEKRDAKKISVS